jgi:hypothetical protein
VKRTLLTNQAGMRNLGADKQGLFSVALMVFKQQYSIQNDITGWLIFLIN